MPLVANNILKKIYRTAAESDFYVALKEGGDGQLVKAGTGGLGRHFNYHLTREALNINDINRKASMGALNIFKLDDLCKAFDKGLTLLGQTYKKNPNKHIICLSLLVIQKTATFQIAEIQERAFLKLLDFYEHEDGYKGQKLSPNSDNAETVLSYLEKLYKDFQAVKRKLGEEKQQQNETRTPPSGPRFGNIRSLFFNPSTRAIIPTSPTSEDPSDQDLLQDRLTVRNQLDEMSRRSTPDKDTIIKINEIKITQKVLMLILIPKLTLNQVKVLSNWMNTIQITSPNNEDKTFDTIRTEAGLFRRYWFGPLGNTRTWQTVAEKVQEVMLTKLTEEKFNARHQHRFDDLAQYDIETRLVHKLPLAPAEYTEYYGLFRASYSRSPDNTPSVFDRFTNRFETDPTYRVGRP